MGEHLPAAQDVALAWLEEQARPQAPQFAVDVLVFVSQPSSGFGEAGSLQLPLPAMHVELQVPPEQDRVATLLLLQLRPQTPQLSGSVLTLVSQPLSAVGGEGCVQLLYPDWHSESHLPIEQERDETWLDEHFRPQAPQLSGSNATDVSHPLSIAGGLGVVQSSYPDAHVGLQTPPLQASVCTLDELQTCPQAPQLLVSVPVLVSQPSSSAGARGWVQLAHPLEQVESQRPAEHEADETWPVAHFRPHAPQLLALDASSVSQPSSAVGAVGDTQSPYPGLQLGLQTPALHDCDVVLFVEQLRLHAPQLLESIWMLVSQPLAGLPSQSAYPVSQLAIAQAPASHLAVAFFRLQAFPQ